MKRLNPVSWLFQLLTFGCALALLAVAGCGGGSTGGGSSLGPPSITGVETVLHSFTGGSTDGASPYTHNDLIQASDGSYYGTTNTGGASGVGVLFEYNPVSGVVVLHSFIPSPDGYTPTGGLTEASGVLYGTTNMGGSFNYGITYSYNPGSGSYGIAAAFNGTTSGNYPLGTMVAGRDGNLYGVDNTSPSRPTVFQYNVSTNAVSAVYSSSTSGQYNGVIMGSDGNFYGMDRSGGANGTGSVFELPVNWTGTPAFGPIIILHSFGSGASDGTSPYGKLVQASDGYLYGLTSAGGTSSAGTVFRIATNGSGYTVLHNFAGAPADGALPSGSLIQASDGYLYGLTSAGGANNFGTVFSIAYGASGTLKVQYSFAGGSDGNGPMASLTQGKDGALYGMTNMGGTSNTGTLFKIK